MVPLWFGVGLLVATAPAAPARHADAEASLFSATPVECERVRAAIDAERDGPFIAPEPLRELAKGECAAAIAAGRWPELTLALAGADGAWRRSVLCTLGPPEAVPILMTWLTSPSTDLDGPECGLTLLHVAPDAFSRLMDRRQLSAANSKVVDPLVLGMAYRIPSAERAVLLPALEQATTLQLEERDALYEGVCVAEPARSAPACAPGSAHLERTRHDYEKLRQVIPAFLPHALCAIAYALLSAIAQRKWGRVAVPCSVAGVGTTAVLMLSCLLLSDQNAGSASGGATAAIASGLSVLIGLPIAVLAGFLIHAL